LQRTVITDEDPGVQQGNREADDPKAKIVKYIPAESVALYTTTASVLEGLDFTKRDLNTALWITVLIGLIGTPIYLQRVYNVSKRAINSFHIRIRFLRITPRVHTSLGSHGGVSC
jgi:hypothetical protein